ncbi:hypothetical protein BZG36_03329 [Bifiguratus adelaidae]|uniref:UBX domain-containing protein n=1 Tax=Bifiguratus adelaidae TaxID=1938954 RepID=A0A261XXT3_9FUNG|nr:hypothetical protein BZG36_03329 [Bifiguratus adelaidae]
MFSPVPPRYSEDDLFRFVSFNASNATTHVVTQNFDMDGSSIKQEKPATMDCHSGSSVSSDSDDEASIKKRLRSKLDHKGAESDSALSKSHHANDRVRKRCRSTSDQQATPVSHGSTLKGRILAKSEINVRDRNIQVWYPHHLKSKHAHKNTASPGPVPMIKTNFSHPQLFQPDLTLVSHNVHGTSRRPSHRRQEGKLVPHLPSMHENNYRLPYGPLTSPGEAACDTSDALKLDTRLVDSNDQNVVPFSVDTLIIGSWRRFLIADDPDNQLACVCDLEGEKLSWRVADSENFYKVEVSLEAATSLELTIGGESSVSSLQIELSETPMFWIKSNKDPNTLKKNRKRPQWAQCNDFTESKQASRNFVHILRGSTSQLYDSVFKIGDVRPSIRRVTKVIDATGYRLQLPANRQQSIMPASPVAMFPYPTHQFDPAAGHTMYQSAPSNPKARSASAPCFISSYPDSTQWTTPTGWTSDAFPQQSFDYSVPPYSSELNSPSTYPSYANSLATDEDFYQLVSVDNEEGSSSAEIDALPTPDGNPSFAEDVVDLHMEFINSHYDEGEFLDLAMPYGSGDGMLTLNKMKEKPVNRSLRILPSQRFGICSSAKALLKNWLLPVATRLRLGNYVSRGDCRKEYIVDNCLLDPIRQVPSVYMWREGVMRHTLEGPITLDELRMKITDCLEANAPSQVAGGAVTQSGTSLPTAATPTQVPVGTNSVPDTTTFNSSATATPSTSGAQADALPSSTVDEKKAKLQQKLAEARRARAEREQEETKQKELKRRTDGKAVLTAKEAFEEKKTKLLAQEIERQKMQDKEYKRQIEAQIEADKRERLASRSSQANGSSTANSPAISSSQASSRNSLNTSSKSTDCKLVIRQTNGQVLRNTFEAKTTLEGVREWIATHRTDGDVPYILMQSFPNRQFSTGEEASTLRDLGLLPSNTLFMKACRGISEAYDGSQEGYISSVTKTVTGLASMGYNVATSLVGSIVGWSSGQESAGSADGAASSSSPRQRDDERTRYNGNSLMQE